MHWGGGVGYAWEFLVGVCHPVLHILTLFQTKKCHFPRPFSDQTSQIHTRFQTWPLAGNYVIITKIREQTKKFFKCILNSHSFILYLLLWNWNGKYKYVHTQPIVPSKTIPSSRPKWAKFIPAFGPKRPKNQTIPSGSAHTCMAYIRESLPLSVGQYKVGVMGSTYLPKKPNQLLCAFSLFTQDIKLLLHVVPSHFQISPLYHTRLKQLQVQWLCVQNCTAGENLHLSQCLWSLIDPATV